ncbi:MAG: lipid-A-disaccharide synthase [Candidatus Margulisbacteria bacterium]|nr:lipid-A-disaccharide synthase [Candidatus Margulisiibacteriota bacterium]
MVSAGEVSGDFHGSFLVKELKKLRPDISFFGIGSEQLAAAGVDIKIDLTKRSSIGMFEALPNILPIFSAFQKTKKLILAENPDLVILIDSQGINMPLASFCKKRGIKTVYYIAPQEWLWGTNKGVIKVAQTVDLIVAIFEKEYNTYKAAGANVVYFGHPLIDIVKPSSIVSRSEQTTVSLCPGSRRQEIDSLLPILLKTGELIKKEFPAARFIMPVASTKISATIASRLSGFKPVMTIGRTYDDLFSSDLAICASGTINLEAAILGVPNFMVYKLSPLSYFIGKHVLKVDKKIKYFSMPNILLDELVIPEFTMRDANPDKIAAAAVALLNNKERQVKMRAAFDALCVKLGQPGMIRKIAAAILSG